MGMDEYQCMNKGRPHKMKLNLKKKKSKKKREQILSMLNSTNAFSTISGNILIYDLIKIFNDFTFNGHDCSNTLWL